MSIEDEAIAAARRRRRAKLREVLAWMNAEDLKVAQWAKEHPDDYRGLNRRLKVVRDKARERFGYDGVSPFA